MDEVTITMTKNKRRPEGAQDFRLPFSVLSVMLLCGAFWSIEGFPEAHSSF